VPCYPEDKVIASQLCYFILALANLLRRFATQETPYLRGHKKISWYHNF